MRGADRWLVVVALAAGALFFASLGKLWPLVAGDVLRGAGDLSAAVRAPLAREGIELEGRSVGSRLRVDDPALTFVERACGREAAQGFIRAGLPLVFYRLTAKAAGDPDGLTVLVHPDGRLLGWDLSVQEDAVAPGVDDAGAELVARRAASDGLGIDLAGWRRCEASSRIGPARVDHRLVFEQVVQAEPEVRERLECTVAGSRVVRAWRTVVVPAAAQRDARALDAWVRGGQTLGFALLTVATVAAAAIFLRRLGTGVAGAGAGGWTFARVRLGPAAWTVAVVAVLLLVVDVLQQALLFELWDPLAPRWLAMGRDLLSWVMDDLEFVLPLFAFIAAGDALDRDRRDAVAADRAGALWALARGEWRDPRVAAASGRGFLIGLICGGVLAAGALLAAHLPGARIELQPRGFFFYPLNTAAPFVTTVCFFSQTSLLEECGYRFFAGTWIWRLTGRKWAGIVIPSIVFGLTHTAYDFLPPADPWWARPIIMAAVGCVWAWAFFRYGLLTVLLSHLSCDFFIFTWPRVGSGRWDEIVPAAGLVLLPLIPAVAGWCFRRGPPAPTPAAGPR